MRKLYINCDSGVSGDMMLGAFLNLGVPGEYLKEKLNRLHLDEFELQISGKEAHGKDTTDVDVVLKEPENLNRNPYKFSGRTYGEVIELLNKSSLSNNEKVLSRRIFDIKANAEAKVHGVSTEEVRFHEVGAVDSIVDIVGTAVCCEYINADLVISNNVPTGYGKVKCAVGHLPVPAPAVRQILADTEIPHYRSDIPYEVLTPTGASIIAGITDDFGWDTIDEEVIGRGYGSGKRDTGLPPLELILCEEKKNA